MNQQTEQHRTARAADVKTQTPKPYSPDKTTQDGIEPESDEVSGYSCQFGKNRRQRNMVPDVLSAKPS